MVLHDHDETQSSPIISLQWLATSDYLTLKVLLNTEAQDVFQRNDAHIVHLIDFVGWHRRALEGSAPLSIQYLGGTVGCLMGNCNRGNTFQ